MEGMIEAARPWVLLTLSVPVKGTYELTFTADPHPPRTSSVDVDADRVNVELCSL